MRIRALRALLPLALTAAVVAAPAGAVFAEGGASFPDFQASAWWAPGMYVTTALGLIQGVGQPNGQATLDPNGVVTRAQWATLMVRAGGYAHPAPVWTQPFADVSASDWFAPYVDALVKAGVIHPQSGAYPSGDFQANAPISRAQAAAWAGRVLEQRGASLADIGSLHPVTVLDEATQNALNKGPVAYDAMQWDSVPMPSAPQSVNFSDLPTSTPGYTSIMEAARYGVIDGFPGGTFQPQGTLTRAQAAKMGAILANEITSGAPTTLQLQAVAQHVDDALTAAMKSLPAGAVTASQVSSALQSAGMSQYAAPAALAGPDGTVASVVGMKAHHPHLGALQVQIDRCRPVFLGSTVAEIDCSTSGTATRANGTLYHPIPIQQGLWLYFVRSGSTWRETDLQFTGTTLPTWATTSK